MSNILINSSDISQTTQSDDKNFANLSQNNDFNSKNTENSDNISEKVQTDINTDSDVNIVSNKTFNTTLTNSLDEIKRSINTQLINSQTCNEESWQNAYGVKFYGCEKTKIGDTEHFVWKLWDDALQDGDLCVKPDETGQLQAYMKSEC